MFTVLTLTGILMHLFVPERMTRGERQASTVREIMLSSSFFLRT